jgi:hypothetical protein
MSQPADVVTVYRSMDASAKTDCQTIIELLAARGIAGSMADDSAPGVPEGTFEVRVRAPDAAQAEKLMAESSLPDEVETADDSENLDLVTIGNMAELEAMEVKGLLESNGIATVLVGDSVLPNFPFEVKVARDQADRARDLITEVERAAEADQSDE